MNYFTPERLVRLQDRSNERQFLAALDEWEGILESYRHHLNELQREMGGKQSPSSSNSRRFLNFLTTVSLHDARVLEMYWGGRSRFRIALHPESPSGRLVILSYSLTQPPQIKPHVLPEPLLSEPIAWLYDELALEEGTGKGKRVFCHAILLSDGSEVRLHFGSVSIERPIPLVPAIPASPGSR
jgi:hypothetical protein